jgi:hypothetical protein
MLFMFSLAKVKSLSDFVARFSYTVIPACPESLCRRVKDSGQAGMTLQAKCIKTFPR